MQRAKKGTGKGLRDRLSSIPGRVSFSDTALAEAERARRFVAYLQDSESTTSEFFVGIVPSSHEAVTEELVDSKLSASYISYPKVLPDGSIEVVESSSWVYRSWLLSHFQLHVVLFELSNADSVVHVFCHHESNWLRHPVQHLRRGYLNSEWGRIQTVELLEESGLSVKTSVSISFERKNELQGETV